MKKLIGVLGGLFLLNVLLMAQPPTLEELQPKMCEKAAILSSFKIKREENKGAIEILEFVMNYPKTLDSHQLSLEEMNGKLGKEIPGAETKVHRLQQRISKIIGNGAKTPEDYIKKKEKIACNIANYLHRYYLENPEELLRLKLKKQYALYSGQQGLADSTPKGVNTSSQKTDAMSLADFKKLSNDVKAMKSQGGIGLGGLFFWTLLVGFVVYFLLKKQMGQIISRLRKEILPPDLHQQLGKIDESSAKGESLSNLIHQQFVRKDHFNRAIDELRSDVRQLKAEVSANRKMMENSQRSVVDIPVPKSVAAAVEVIPEPEPEIELYSPPPTKDGLFYGNQIKRSFVAGKSFYLIKMKSNHSTTAQFTLLQNDNVIRQAASMPGAYLTSACHLRGTGNMMQARHISMEPGQLSKQGNDWRVTEKAIVKWE